MSESNARPVLATLASFVSLVSLGGATALGLNMAGIPMLPVTEEAPVAPAATVDQRTVLVSKDSPAAKAINKVMAGDKKLFGSGQVNIGGAPALPYSCPAGALGASYSAARNFSFQGARMKVVASAYTAGYGAIAFQGFKDSARGCANGIGTLGGWNESVGKNPAYVTNFRQSGGTTHTMMVRFGDTILHVQGQANKVRGAATHAVKLLESAGTCASPNQGPSAFTRNPLAGNSFVGRFVDEPVKVTNPEPPAVPKDAKFKALKEDAKLAAYPTLITPATEPSYPVFPVMPNPVEAPHKPTAPVLPPLKTTVKVLAQDKTGPGCGWAYTDSPGASWDAKAAMKLNTQTVDDAAAVLDDGVQAWEQETLEYWKAATAYEKDVKAYTVYADEVSSVNAAWSVIAKQWAAYRTAEANWQEHEASIKKFQSDKESATIKYTGALAECETDLAAPLPPEETETAAPLEGEDTEETLEPVPVPVPVEIIPCADQVQKPAIVDQTAPESLVRPTAPADPRPAVESDGA